MSSYQNKDVTVTWDDNLVICNIEGLLDVYPFTKGIVKLNQDLNLTDIYWILRNAWVQDDMLCRFNMKVVNPFVIYKHIEMPDGCQVNIFKPELINNWRVIDGS